MKKLFMAHCISIKALRASYQKKEREKHTHTHTHTHTITNTTITHACTLT